VTASFPLPDGPPATDDAGPSRRAASRHELPARALDTSAEHPWPVRLLSRKIEQYVERMAPVWVEGQVVQLNRRPGTSTAFLTLRDTDQDMSLPVSAAVRVLDGTRLEEGAHVVVHGKPVFWSRRGTLQLQAREIRPVGVGELLARVEHLRRVLAAEGLFDAGRKVALPFLPRVVGLVCGRESKAEHDVVVNARARWPQVRFEIREVAVQGVHAVEQVGAALRELDARPEVEVIVVARGGGSVEDLLPFSNETLVRAAAACRTPLVSAIGHETDCPLLDLVADHRASTPTAAAKRIVPDVSEERSRVSQARERARAAVEARVAREQAALDAVRSRPVLASPEVMLADRAERVEILRDRGRRALGSCLLRAAGEVGRLGAQVRALSPASTLERGYAVVQRGDGHVVRSPDDVAVGDALRVRLAHGQVAAQVVGDEHAAGTT
jgi:exodeoxyribonuclease VII large subunit